MPQPGPSPGGQPVAHQGQILSGGQFPDHAGNGHPDAGAIAEKRGGVYGDRQHGQGSLSIADPPARRHADANTPAGRIGGAFPRRVGFPG